MGNKCPCRECKNRYRACWGSCDKYKEWRKVYDAVKNEEERQKRIESEMVDYEIKRDQKFKRRSNTK